MWFVETSFSVTGTSDGCVYSVGIPPKRAARPDRPTDQDCARVDPAGAGDSDDVTMRSDDAVDAKV